MKSVFVVQHLHVLPHEEEDVKLIGVYRTRAAAVAAIERLKLKPGFCNFPDIVGPRSTDNQGFHMDEYALDMDHWTEGYITLPDGSHGSDQSAEA